MTRDGSTATSKRKFSPTTIAAATAVMKHLDADRHHHQHQHPPAEAAASVWTEEMHSSFMNGMEAAFVHDILFGGWPAAIHPSACNQDLRHQHHHQQQQDHPTTASTLTDAAPRLDRYMPDSAESTRDGHEDDDASPAPAAPAARASVARRSRGGKIMRRKHGCIAEAKPYGRVPVHPPPLLELLR